MPKTVKLFLCGILPLAVGWMFHWAILYLPVSGFLLGLFSLLYLVLWGYLSYRLAGPYTVPALQALLMSLFGALMLALVLYQELVLEAYWTNCIGLAGQLYFLPALAVAARIMTPILSAVMGVVGLWPEYIAEWVCMFAISLAGGLIKARK